MAPFRPMTLMVWFVSLSFFTMAGGFAEEGRDAAAPSVVTGSGPGEATGGAQAAPAAGAIPAAPTVVSRLTEDGIHDPDNPSLSLLQEPAQALSGFPRDMKGGVDWIAVLDQGLIDPRADLKGEGSMDVLDLDILMKNTRSMPFVRFPHKSHTRWLDCENCHPDIFIPKLAANKVNMNEIFRGRFCGNCHGRVAFSVYVCQRCHSVPHAGSPGVWWK
ncbi:MAG: hypothetical protein HQL57_03770 [Magnetococcales bacterium]|nr:hypothetical protein [Magnetococcales bacterium]MBF0156287.1 hypothetical protein [Magnetococcales bacterium]